MAAPYFRLAFTGDTGVGKTQIITRYVSDSFSTDSNPTIGLDFKTKEVHMKDGNVKTVQIWDTAGDPRFQAMSPGYLLTRCNGIIIVFDLGNSASFYSLQTTINSVMSEVRRPIPMLLLGNKLDSPREISFESASKFAHSFDLIYSEVSAKSNLQITPTLDGFIHSISHSAVNY